MNSSQEARVAVLFQTAAPLDRAGRAELLAGNAADDPEVLRELRFLLAADETGLDFTGETNGPLGDLVTASAALTTETQVGPYRTLKLLGKGGMGTVWLAERADNQFQAKVAIKLVRTDRESPEVLARFRAERQILSTLVHPNIARLFDAGVTPSGTPYLVMEYVDGIPVTEYCENHNLDIRARLRLFSRICGAVACAHRSLVVHRDIKPSNILVSPDGEPKLLDFGVARMLSPDGDAPESGLTREGERVGTPEYSAPEQVLYQRVSTATDVYALGVLLYEMLTGTRPFRQLGSSYELDRAICETGPDLPSAALANTRGTTLNNLLRGDLDSIILMALRKDPTARYGSVEGLLADIEAYLEGFPVEAGRHAVRYRCSRFVRRHWLGLSFAAVCAALLPLLVVAFDRLERSTFAAQNMARVGLATQSIAANGMYSEAEQILRPRLFLERQVIIWPRLDRVVKVYVALASSLLNQGKLAQAETVFREGLATGLAVPKQGLDLSGLRSGLALVRRKQGAYAESEVLYRRALADNLQPPGRGAPSEARDLCGLGSLLARTSEAAESETMLTRCLALRQAQPGERSMPTAEALALLADLRARQQQFDAATQLYGRAIDTERALFPGGHPQTATHLLGLARLLLDNRQSAEAGAAVREALQIRRFFFPADSWLISEAENVEGAVLEATHPDNEAGETEAREILARTRNRLLRDPGPETEVAQLARGPR